jgi:hypothetical protein
MVSSTYDHFPDASPATLRIHGISGVPVEQVQVFLARLVRSYNSIYVFDSIIRQLDSQRLAVRELGPEFPDRAYRLRGVWTLVPRISLDIFNIPFERVSEMVPANSQLALQRVSLNSPGFWEFFGKLNPLEVIRLGLNDRHERRKDKGYREKHESERMRLENELLQSKVFASQLQVLNELGLTDEEKAVLKNRLLHAPFEALAITQDRNLIGTAEFILPEKKSDR